MFRLLFAAMALSLGVAGPLVASDHPEWYADIKVNWPSSPYDPVSDSMHDRTD